MAKKAETTEAATPAPNFAVKSKGHAERRVYAANEREAVAVFKKECGILDTENAIEVSAITGG